MIRYPSITGKTPEEQIEQLRRALYQLIDQINFEMNEIRRKEDNHGSNQ